jgi:hypothetical protein
VEYTFTLKKKGTTIYSVKKSRDLNYCFLFSFFYSEQKIMCGPWKEYVHVELQAQDEKHFKTF